MGGIHNAVLPGGHCTRNVDLELQQIPFGVFHEDLDTRRSTEADRLAADIHWGDFGVELYPANHAPVVERYETIRETNPRQSIRLAGILEPGQTPGSRHFPFSRFTTLLT